MAITSKAASIVEFLGHSFSSFRQSDIASNRAAILSAIAMGFLLKTLLLGKNNRLIKSPEAVVRTKDGRVEEYDFIIIGGGTAGCVIASRLSEDPSVKVLLLESGISGKSLIFSRIPVAFSNLFHGKHVYNLWTEPQENVGGKKKYWPRANMLGGCSSINAQMAQYGAPQDFDQWASIIGDDSWAWANFKKNFQKFERFIPHPDFPHVNTAIRGSNGPVKVGYFTTSSEQTSAFIQTAIKVGIPFKPDFNTTEGTRGVNRVLTYVDESRERVSSETAYLTDDVLARPNLRVVIGAHVNKIITETVGGEVRATGVEFAKKKGGRVYRINSRREVILSAGAIHSPHILLLSGIGPATQLKQHSIPVAKDLPGVGAHLVDHPVVDVYFKSKANSPNYLKPRNPIHLIKYLGAAVQYLATRRGPLANNFGEAAAFVRSDDPALFPKADFPLTIADSTSGDDAPDLEIFTTPLAYKEHGSYMFPMHTFAVHVCLLRPLSVGSLTLKSADPWVQPAMDPKYLSAAEDIERLKRGIRMILGISKQEPFASHLDQNDTHELLDHQTHKKTDAELEELIRDRLETLYHPAGTCRMAPLEKGGVVDSKLRVYGVKGLRVGDASIFPEIVSGHTAGACFAIGEHLSTILSEEIKTSRK